MGKIEKKRNTKKNKRSMRLKTRRNNRIGGSPESDKAKIKSIDKKISDVNEDIKDAKREYNRSSRELRTVERSMRDSINLLRKKADHYKNEKDKNSRDFFNALTEGTITPFIEQRIIHGINTLEQQETVVRNDYINQVQNYDNIVSTNEYNFENLNNLELYLDELQQEREAIERRIKRSGKSPKSPKSPGTPKKEV